MTMKLTAAAIAAAAVIAQAMADREKLADSIAPILALTPDKVASDPEAAKAAATKLSESVRAYATASEAAGIPAKRAGDALRFSLLDAGKPSGTAANYGRAVEGFRTVEAGEKRNAMTMPQAQKAMRTAKQVAKDEALTKLRPYLKAATAKQVEALAAYAAELGIKLPEKKAGPVTTTEGAAVAEPEAEAAVA